MCDKIPALVVEFEALSNINKILNAKTHQSWEGEGKYIQFVYLYLIVGYIQRRKLPFRFPQRSKN